MSQAPPVIPGLSAVVERYDGFILDLWGCLHDGVKPYPGSLDALRRLRAAGKRTLAVSNGPRRAASVASTTRQIGIDPALLDGVLSAGEVAWQAIVDRRDPWHARLGRQALHIGADRDRGMFEGNGLKRTRDVATADFILLTGPMDDEWELPQHEDLLRAALARRLPMVCANPDLDVVKGDVRLICAGAIAARYAMLGGDVVQHGKPERAIYERALRELGVTDPRRVLACGDSFHTDVSGAHRAGIDVAFIPGGIHADEVGYRPGEIPDVAAVAALMAQYSVTPTWILPELKW
ncbi:MAG: TIGR01459 family HAD-type hydrolase [Alphaproteobacteria bacterium]|nr:TIGR01459 family HAD-type hydrolase [Alphaproteobacteria bacterium]